MNVGRQMLRARHTAFEQQFPTVAWSQQGPTCVWQIRHNCLSPRLLDRRGEPWEYSFGGGQHRIDGWCGVGGTVVEHMQHIHKCSTCSERARRVRTPCRDDAHGCRIYVDSDDMHVLMISIYTHTWMSAPCPCWYHAYVGGKYTLMKCKSW